MSLTRLVRYVVGLLIAVALIYIVCPLIGITKAKFLPPPSVYANATGSATGYITAIRSEITNNPFDVGGHMYFIDYRFRAPDPTVPDGKATAVYTGSVRVNQQDHDAAKSEGVGTTITVRYETTYPWINGIPYDKIGISCGEGSNILSGWLIFVVAAFILGFFIMLILEKFGGREDI